MSSTERFVTLLTGIVTMIGLAGAALRYLMTISWRMGQLVERFSDHVSDASKIHQDQEQRLRLVEQQQRRRQW